DPPHPVVSAHGEGPPFVKAETSDQPHREREPPLPQLFFLLIPLCVYGNPSAVLKGRYKAHGGRPVFYRSRRKIWEPAYRQPKAYWVCLTQGARTRILEDALTISHR